MRAQRGWRDGAAVGRLDAPHCAGVVYRNSADPVAALTFIASYFGMVSWVGCTCRCTQSAPVCLSCSNVPRSAIQYLLSLEPAPICFNHPLNPLQSAAIRCNPLARMIHLTCLIRFTRFNHLPSCPLNRLLGVLLPSGSLSCVQDKSSSITPSTAREDIVSSPPASPNVKPPDPSYNMETSNPQRYPTPRRVSSST